MCLNQSVSAVALIRNLSAELDLAVYEQNFRATSCVRGKGLGIWFSAGEQLVLLSGGPHKLDDRYFQANHPNFRCHEKSLQWQWFLGSPISNWTYHELDQDPKSLWVPPQFAGAFGPENEYHPSLQAAFSAAFETRSIRLDLDLTAPLRMGRGVGSWGPKRFCLFWS